MFAVLCSSPLTIVAPTYFTATTLDYAPGERMRSDEFTVNSDGREFFILFLFFQFCFFWGGVKGRSGKSSAISKFLWAVKQHVTDYTITQTQVFIIMQMSVVSFRAHWFHFQLFSLTTQVLSYFSLISLFSFLFLSCFFLFLKEGGGACWIKVRKWEFQRMPSSMLCFETPNEQQLIKRIYKTVSVMNMLLVPFKVSALWISLSEYNIIRVV